MAVQLIIIAGVAILVAALILFIVLKILRQRKDKARTEENAVETDKARREYGNEGDVKKKKRKKGEKRKTENKKNGEESGEGGVDESRGGLDKSSVCNEDSEKSLLSKLLISISYNKQEKQLLLTIHRGENFALTSNSKFEIRVTLLPAKRQKLKTKIQLSNNPVFNEVLVFHDVLPEDISLGTLRARVYRLIDRQRKMIGQLKAELKADLGLADMDLYWCDLTPVTDITEDISDSEFITNPESVLAAPKEMSPMIQISLQYRTITGKLTVEIIKARHIKTINMQKAPETYVEVSLQNKTGTEVACKKTAVSKGSFHPMFEESFFFSVIEFELSGFTLIFSVYAKKFRKREQIGWFCLGRESSGERENLHWNEMIDAHGEPVKAWYLLTG